ncbi:MAG: DegT/DnrJ/EryC1/StrS aminotransferase family protein [Candidatus Eremiobacteraeota bacterium]|nr:DegT/DnrJ/EryC1/StrS aminotransferase family protein [Candidatus Eremiobacteraeota bacterium]
MRNEFLPYCRPDVGEQELAAVARSMRNGWLTTGPQTAAFEEAFSAASGIPYAVALNSCTAGLHLVLAALGIGPGDEVVMPSLTFAAGAQCTLELGATPVFCDVELDTFSASPRTIESVLTPRTRAIVAMPYAGRPQNIGTLVDLARDRGIAIVEDAAHAAGTLDRGRWAGALSDAAVYSFYATKNLTTGEGGMLVTHDAELADRVRRLSLHGMSRDAWKRYTDKGSWRYDVVEPGFKYNITDIASSMGLVQLGRLPEMQRRRDELALRYLRELSAIEGLSFQRECDEPGDRTSWCMFAICVDPATGLERDALIEELRKRNVGTSVHYIPTHHFSAYRDLPRAPLPNTDALAKRILSLPLYPTMSDEDVTSVIEAVRECFAFKPIPS